MKRSPFPHAPGAATRAFTLIELLTVIAIIGILAAILIPVTARVRGSAKAATCSSNLRQIHAAMMLWANDNKHAYLPAKGEAFQSGHYWRWYGSQYSSASLAPFGLSPLAGYMGFPTNVADGQRALNKITVCPLNQQDTPVGGAVAGAYGYPYMANYWIMAHQASSSPMPKKPLKLSALDRPSQLVMLVDGPDNLATWTGEGFNAKSSFLSRGSDSHGGKANILYADGHVGRSAKADIAEDKIIP